MCDFNPQSINQFIKINFDIVHVYCTGNYFCVTVFYNLCCVAMLNVVDQSLGRSGGDGGDGRVGGKCLCAHSDA